jgi:hypothetical protein
MNELASLIYRLVELLRECLAGVLATFRALPGIGSEGNVYINDRKFRLVKQVGSSQP